MLARVYRAIRSLGPIDLRSVRRDGLMLMLLIIPLIAALVLRFAVPPLHDLLQAELDFDLRPYYPLLMSTLVLTAPNMIGVIVGFLLLDERDDGTLAAIMVSPLSTMGFLLYRILVPSVLGFIMTMIAYPLGGLAPLPWGDLVLISLVAMITAPIVALGLAAFSDNKVAGLVVQKVLNAIGVVPVAAFFLTLPLQLVAGVLPTYWPMKMTWLAATGEPYWLFGVAGIAVNAVFLVWLSRRFLRRIHS